MLGVREEKKGPAESAGHPDKRNRQPHPWGGWCRLPGVMVAEATLTGIPARPWLVAAPGVGQRPSEDKRQRNCVRSAALCARGCS